MKTEPFIRFATPVQKRILGIRYASMRVERVSPHCLAQKMKEYLLTCTCHQLMVFPDSRPFSKELERGNLQYVFNTFADKDSNKRLFERLQTIGMNPSADIGFLRVNDYGPNRNAFGDLPGGKFYSLEKSLNSISIIKKDAAIDLIVPTLISDLAVENDDTELAVALGPDSVGFYAYYVL